MKTPEQRAELIAQLLEYAGKSCGRYVAAERRRGEHQDHCQKCGFAYGKHLAKAAAKEIRFLDAQWTSLSEWVGREEEIYG